MTSHMDEVSSPCTGVCQIDKTKGQCIGCHRTLQEIAVWMNLTSDQRALLMAEIAERATKPA